MNQLRHLAIRTEEPEKLAAFYIEAFGFREVREGLPPAQGQESRSFHLTDGYFELAILANGPNQSPNGLYHFGIKVDEWMRRFAGWKAFRSAFSEDRKIHPSLNCGCRTSMEIFWICRYMGSWITSR